MIILVIVALLATYADYQCLRKGTLCPKYLEMEEAVRRRKDDNAVRVHPSLYLDLVQMTSQLPRTSQIAMLLGEHVAGAVWTTPMEGYARNPTHDAETWVDGDSLSVRCEQTVLRSATCGKQHDELSQLWLNVKIRCQASLEPPWYVGWRIVMWKTFDSLKEI